MEHRTDFQNKSTSVFAFAQTLSDRAREMSRAGGECFLARIPLQVCSPRIYKKSIAHMSYISWSQTQLSSLKLGEEDPEDLSSDHRALPKEIKEL